MGVNAPLDRKLRMGLVGGGQGAFIGRVHATAAVMDNRAVLVAGALSSDAAKAKVSAPDYDIKAERAYPSYQEMAAAEAKLPADQRIDFVTVATPNHTHFEIAKVFAEAGFNVMCDKPLTFDLAPTPGLNPAKDKHMHGATYTFIDADHFKLEGVSWENGKSVPCGPPVVFTRR